MLSGADPEFLSRDQGKSSEDELANAGLLNPFSVFFTKLQTLLHSPTSPFILLVERSGGNVNLVFSIPGCLSLNIS